MKNQVILRNESNRIFIKTPTRFLLKKGASAFRILTIALGIAILGTLICGSVGCNKTDNVEPEITDEMIHGWIKDMDNYIQHSLLSNSAAYKGLLNAGNQVVQPLIDNLLYLTYGETDASQRWSAYLLGILGFDRFDEVYEILLSVAEDVYVEGDGEYSRMVEIQALQGLGKLFEQQEPQATIDYIMNKGNPPLGREAAITTLGHRINRSTEIGKVIFIKLKEILLDIEEIDKIREETAWAFFLIANEEDEAFIIKVFENDPYWRVKDIMAYLLGRIGGSTAIESLGNYGLAYKEGSSNMSIRERSATALGELGSRLGGDDAETALQYLVDALETEEHKEVIDAINEAIAKIDGGKKSGAAKTKLDGFEEVLQME